MVGEGVEEVVARIVVGLFDRADDGGEGGEADEVVELCAAFDGGVVQVPGTEHFRVHDLVKTFVVEFDEEVVVEHHRAVDDTLERWQVAPDVGDDAADVDAAGDVGAGVDDVDAVGPQFGDAGFDVCVARAGAADEDNVFGAVGGHPAGELETEAAGAAGDEVAGVCLEEVFGFGGRGNVDDWLVEVEDVLADVLALSHEAECVDHFGDREDFVG